MTDWIIFRRVYLGSHVGETGFGDAVETLSNLDDDGRWFALFSSSAKTGFADVLTGETI